METTHAARVRLQGIGRAAEMYTGRTADGDCGVGFDGTSSTTMLVDENTGRSLESPQWYNASQSPAAVDCAKVLERGSTLRPVSGFVTGHCPRTPSGTGLHLDAVQGTPVASGKRLAAAPSKGKASQSDASSRLAVLPHARCTPLLALPS